MDLKPQCVISALKKTFNKLLSVISNEFTNDYFKQIMCNLLYTDDNLHRKQTNRNGKNDFVLSGVTLQNYFLFLCRKLYFFTLYMKMHLRAAEILSFCEKTYQNI